jgi:hypothetical protein
MRQSDNEETGEERSDEEGGGEAGSGVEMWWHVEFIYTRNEW